MGADAGAALSLVFALAGRPAFAGRRNEKGGPSPPLFRASMSCPRRPDARAELSTPPGLKSYFFLAFLAFFAFFAFFAFLAIVSSQGLMD